MFVVQNEPAMVVGASEGTVFVVRGTATQERIVTIENLDAVNTLTYRYQQSNTGADSDYTDVAANDTLAPGARITVVLSGFVFYRLRGSGSLNIAVQVHAVRDIIASEFVTT
jgi:hypothetical protein